jgi:hypothetical protein
MEIEENLTPETKSGHPFAEKSAFAPATWPQLVIVAVLAMLFTLFVLQYSSRIGRLAGDIVPDDSGYFVDGAKRLQKFYSGGIPALWKSYLENEPHSPWSSALTLGAFLLFGLEDWAPYALNASLVAVTLWFATRLVAPASCYLQLGAIVFALTTPFLLNAVHEFRPDYAAALFTAIGSFLLLLSGRSDDLRSAAQGSLFFGLAFLAKPSISPLTLAMFGLSVAAAILLRTEFQWRSLYSRTNIRLALWTLLPCLLVALPHYVVHHKGIFGYIHASLFAKSAEVWKSNLSLKDSLLYYLVGRGGEAMLGFHIYVIGTLAIVSLIILWRQGDRGSRRFLLAMIGVLIVSFIIPTFTNNKSPFFGLTFQLFLFFFLLFLVATAAAALAPQRRRIFVVPVVALFFGGVIFFPASPATLKTEEDGIASVAGKQMNRALVDALRQDDLGNRKEQIVFTNTVGFVNGATLEWLLFKARLRFKVDGSASAELADYRKDVSKANYLILNDVNAYGQATGLPIWKLAGDLVSMVRERPDFKLVRTLPSANGGQYYLYRNLRAKTPPLFFGWSRSENLLVNGRSRCAFVPRASVWFDRDREYPLSLKTTLLSEVAQTYRVLLNGKEVFRQSAQPKEPVNVVVELLAEAGENRLDFEFDQAALRDSVRDLPVTFQKLQIVYNFDSVPPLFGPAAR